MTAAARTAVATRRSEQLAQALAVFMIYAFPAFIYLHFANVNDPDIWWHLRTGEWIALHHAVPRVDSFSTATAGQPWQAYSWLFELAIFRLFHYLGPTGIVFYTTSMLLALSIALYHLFRRLQQDFTLAAGLTLSICLLLIRLYTPRPWLLSILLFILELDILMTARRTGRLLPLLWLPVLLGLWTNLHIQFIDGLAVLAIALVESIIPRRILPNPTRIPAIPIAAVTFACLLATLINPYGWHIYQTAHSLAAQAGALRFVDEMLPLPFRSISDFAILFLAFAAVVALARAPRLLPFESLLLLFAATLSFRSRRDLWLVTITAAMILAAQIKARTTPKLPSLTTIPLTACAVLTLLAAAHLFHLNDARLREHLAETLPVRAVDTSLARHYAGPIYCNYDWGGYLLWQMRLPVSIDGRAGLHGDDRIKRSMDTWYGQPGWDTDPLLLNAGLVVAPVSAPLTQLLRQDPRFKLAYEDQLAALFLPARSATSPARLVSANSVSTR